MATFTLATGLRQTNVKNLKWKDVDLNHQHAWAHPNETKSNKAITASLNETAIAVLHKGLSQSTTFVFTYKANPVVQVNTKAWHNALKRADIKNFRWHDLRDTWASWHVQHGTNLQELQQLGGWLNFDMVLRYAHLGSQQLREAAERIHVTKSLQRQPMKLFKTVERSIT